MNDPTISPKTGAASARNSLQTPAASQAAADLAELLTASLPPDKAAQGLKALEGLLEGMGPQGRAALQEVHRTVISKGIDAIPGSLMPAPALLLHALVNEKPVLSVADLEACVERAQPFVQRLGKPNALFAVTEVLREGIRLDSTQARFIEALQERYRLEAETDDRSTSLAASLDATRRFISSAPTLVPEDLARAGLSLNRIMLDSDFKDINSVSALLRYVCTTSRPALALENADLLDRLNQHSGSGRALPPGATREQVEMLRGARVHVLEGMVGILESRGLLASGEARLRARHLFNEEVHSDSLKLCERMGRMLSNWSRDFASSGGLTEAFNRIADRLQVARDTLAFREPHLPRPTPRVVVKSS